MKVLKVKKENRELASAALTSPTLLVGRSPFCDLVIRNKGIAPVHFIVEWYGMGEFNSQEGSWSIVSVGHVKISDSKAEDMGFGEGYKLSGKDLSLEGFEFVIQEDKLAESHLGHGTLSENLMEDKRFTDLKKMALEVIEVSSDSESVREVYHFPIYEMGEFAIPRAGGLSVVCQNRQENVSAILSLQNMTGVTAYKKGQLIYDGHSDPKTQIPMEASDFIQVHWKLKDFYFRFVPRVEVNKRKLLLFSDPYSLFLLSLIIFVLVGSLLLKKAELKKVEEVKPPPRIAKIEIKVEAPQPAPVQELPPPTPPPEPEPVVETPKPKAEVKNQAQPKMAPATNVKFVSPKSQPKNNTGLNSPAPKADVNTVGLLGSISKTPQPKVRADMVMNNGVVSKTVSGANAQFVIDQPPAGVVGAKTNLKSSGNTISGASTTLSRSDVVSGSNTGPLVGTSKNGLGDNVSFDVQGTDDSKAMDFNRGAQVSGGLDKESVRRVVNSYRKELQTCYERALNQKSKLSGRVSYRWTIKPDGFVSTVRLEKSEANSPSFEDCLMNVVKSMEFPKAPNGQPTIVIYPFVFQSK